MSIISPGNQKMGNIPSFSIPTRVCDLIPGPDEQDCKPHCYAKRIERRSPSARAAYEINFEITKTDAFVAIMDIAIKTNKKVQRMKLMRWHVAGDFYDQTYLERTFKVCELNPSILFFGYTKAYHLDWSRRPANLIMRLSDDKGIWQDHYQKFDAVARVYDPKSECPAGFIPCAAQRVRGMTCEKCTLCTGKKGNVGFKRH